MDKHDGSHHRRVPWLDGHGSPRIRLHRIHGAQECRISEFQIERQMQNIHWDILGYWTKMTKFSICWWRLMVSLSCNGLRNQDLGVNFPKIRSAGQEIRLIFSKEHEFTWIRHILNPSFFFFKGDTPPIGFHPWATLDLTSRRCRVWWGTVRARAATAL